MPDETNTLQKTAFENHSNSRRYLTFQSYYTIGGGGHPREKIFKNFFLEMTPLGVKTCGENPNLTF